MSIGSFVTCFAHSKSDCEDRGEIGFRFCEVKIWDRTLKVLTIVPHLPHSAMLGRYLHTYHTHTHKLLHILPWVKSFLLAFSCFACRTKRDTFFAGRKKNLLLQHFTACMAGRCGLILHTGIRFNIVCKYYTLVVFSTTFHPMEGEPVALAGCVFSGCFFRVWFPCFARSLSIFTTVPCARVRFPPVSVLRAPQIS